MMRPVFTSIITALLLAFAALSPSQAMALDLECGRSSLHLSMAWQLMEPNDAPALYQSAGHCVAARRENPTAVISLSLDKTSQIDSLRELENHLAMSEEVLMEQLGIGYQGKEVLSESPYIGYLKVVRDDEGLVEDLHIGDVIVQANFVAPTKEGLLQVFLFTPTNTLEFHDALKQKIPNALLIEQYQVPQEKPKSNALHFLFYAAAIAAALIAILRLWFWLQNKKRAKVGALPPHLQHGERHAPWEDELGAPPADPSKSQSEGRDPHPDSQDPHDEA